MSRVWLPHSSPCPRIISKLLFIFLSTTIIIFLPPFILPSEVDFQAPFLLLVIYRFSIIPDPHGTIDMGKDVEANASFDGHPLCDDLKAPLLFSGGRDDVASDQSSSASSYTRKEKQYQCSRCQKSPKEQKAEHYAMCTSYRCSRCGLLPKEPKEEHHARCTSYRCSRCLQSPKEPKEEHYANCTRYRCSRCMKLVKVAKLEHQKKCIGQGWQCPRCCKRLLDSKTEHYAKCNRTRYQCTRCFKHPWEPKAEHQKHCTEKRWVCHRCGKCPKESKMKHYAKCAGQKYYCHRCGKCPSKPKAKHNSDAQDSGTSAIAVENIQRDRKKSI